MKNQKYFSELKKSITICFESLFLTFLPSLPVIIVIILIINVIIFIKINLNSSSVLLCPLGLFQTTCEHGLERLNFLFSLLKKKQIGENLYGNW